MILIEGTSDSAKSRRLRTGLTAHLRSLDVGQSIFIRAEATNRNRLSTTIAKFRLTRDGRGRRFITLKVGGGYRVWRQV